MYLEVWMNGKRRLGRRVLISLVALGVTMSLAACATRSAATGSTISAVSGPSAGSRALAETFARELMARFSVPEGTRPSRSSPIPLALRDPWAGPAGVAAAGSVDLGQVDAVPRPVSATVAFMLTHEPGGADLTGSGQESGAAGLREIYIQLGSSSLPRGINDAEGVVLMIPNGAASTLAGIYVHVVWYPARTAAELVDAKDFDSATITATVSNPKPHQVRRTLTSESDIAALAEILNSLPAEPDTTHTCPSTDTSFLVTFNPRTTEQAVVTAASSGCYGVSVTFRGVPQPALLDIRNAIPAAAARMLRVSRR
jgi:hypothetical protein